MTEPAAQPVPLDREEIDQLLVLADNHEGAFMVTALIPRLAAALRSEHARADTAEAEGKELAEESEQMLAAWAEAIQRAETAEAKIELARKEHWQTITLKWGEDTNVPVCGRCSYTDGVSYRWPCPTVRALDGEIPESVRALDEETTDDA